jgi:hypothetical protein
VVLVDANAFTAEIFVNGHSRAQCKIWQGVMHSREGISYADGPTVLNQRARNEMLTLMIGGELALQATMNIGSGGTHEGLNVERLAPRVATSLEGAAEYLWRRTERRDRHRPRSRRTLP